MAVTQPAISAALLFFLILGEAGVTSAFRKKPGQFRKMAEGTANVVGVVPNSWKSGTVSADASVDKDKDSVTAKNASSLGQHNSSIQICGENFECTLHRSKLPYRTGSEDCHCGDKPIGPMYVDSSISDAVRRKSFTKSPAIAVKDHGSFWDYSAFVEGKEVMLGSLKRKANLVINVASG